MGRPDDGLLLVSVRGLETHDYSATIMPRTPLSCRTRDLFYFLFFAVSPSYIYVPDSLPNCRKLHRSIYLPPSSSTSRRFTPRHGFLPPSPAFQSYAWRCRVIL